MSDRSPTNAFASCPAATGEVRGEKRCPTYPDGAHRCGRPREHMHDEPPAGLYREDHGCTCGYLWTLGPSVAQQIQNLERLDSARREYAEHPVVEGPYARGGRIPPPFEAPVERILDAETAHRTTLPPTPPRERTHG